MDLFASYLQHGRYLKGWSRKTEVVYQRAYTSFQKSLGESTAPTGLVAAGEDVPTGTFTKAHLEAWVMWMRQRGLSPACANIYIRALNSYTAWLKAEGHATEQITLKQLPAPVKPVYAFSEADYRAITSFRPKTATDWRLYALVSTLLDTGCRINEVTGLKPPDVDMDNLLLVVHGKGNRTRKVPFSPELRKVLFRWSQYKLRNGIGGAYLFSTRNGTRVMYRNVYRDIIRLCRGVGITKRVHPHLTRHSFACHFMKNGGSIYSLSRILGHSSVSTTQVYVRGLGIEDLAEEQARLSPLSRLR